MAEFYKPASLSETCDLLSRYREKATVVAGGTDVMVSMNRKKISPEIIVAIGDIGLDHIRTEKNCLIIGATATHTAICNSDAVLEHAPLLAEMCGQIGSRAIRNMGTMGGNLANASRSADGAVSLIALEAEVKLVTSSGQRTVPVDSFFTGSGETIKKPEELLQEIIVPFQSSETKWGWYKLGQRKADIRAIISVAIAIRMDNGICQKARIALGAASPTPLLTKKAVRMLEDHPLDPALTEAVANMAADETAPFDDWYATAWYRKKAGRAIVRRVLQQISQQTEDGNADS